jgi:hypothetical protein
MDYTIEQYKGEILSFIRGHRHALTSPLIDEAAHYGMVLYGIVTEGAVRLSQKGTTAFKAVCTLAERLIPDDCGGIMHREVDQLEKIVQTL